MKKKFKLMSAVMALLTISCSAWAQAGKNQVTYTIDGGAFHHQLITINADPKAIQNGAFTNPAGSTYLKVCLDDNSVDNKTGAVFAVYIAFNHVAMGTAKVNEPIPNAVIDHRVNFFVRVQINGKVKFLMPDSNKPAETPGTITITKLGSMGEIVEGNFEGKLIDDHIVYTVTGGHFVATRKSRIRL